VKCSYAPDATILHEDAKAQLTLRRQAPAAGFNHLTDFVRHMNEGNIRRDEPNRDVSCPEQRLPLARREEAREATLDLRRALHGLTTHGYKVGIRRIEARYRRGIVAVEGLRRLDDGTPDCCFISADTRCLCVAGGSMAREPASPGRNAWQQQDRSPPSDRHHGILPPVVSFRRPSNTEISSEDRAILAIAGFVCFISLLDGATFYGVRRTVLPYGDDTFTRRFAHVPQDNRRSNACYDKSGCDARPLTREIRKEDDGEHDGPHTKGGPLKVQK